MAPSMSIRITVGHCLGKGHGDVHSGDVLDVPDDLTVDEATRLVSRKWATVVTPPSSREEDAPAASSGAAGAVETTDAAPTQRDPATPGASPSRKPTGKKAGGKKSGKKTGGKGRKTK